MLPLTKENDNFILKLNQELYKNKIIQKALSEDNEWIKEEPASEGYFCLKLQTSSIEDVLSWVNYLIYLHKV